MFRKKCNKLIFQNNLIKEYIGDRDQDHPQEKKMQKSKMAV